MHSNQSGSEGVWNLKPFNSVAQLLISLKGAEPRPAATPREWPTSLSVSSFTLCFEIQTVLCEPPPAEGYINTELNKVFSFSLFVPPHPHCTSTLKPPTFTTFAGTPATSPGRRPLRADAGCTSLQKVSRLPHDAFSFLAPVCACCF